MDSIAFTITKDEDAGVQIIINGRNLIEIVRDIELPFATREGSPSIAGAYSGLPANTVFLPSRHFLGEPDPCYADEKGRVHTLVCSGCGESGCWPLSVRIKFREAEVWWSDFYQPHRGPDAAAGEWRYDALPIFKFDRESYEMALSPKLRHTP